MTLDGERSRLHARNKGLSDVAKFAFPQQKMTSAFFFAALFPYVCRKQIAQRRPSFLSPMKCYTYRIDLTHFSVAILKAFYFFFVSNKYSYGIRFLSLPFSSSHPKINGNFYSALTGGSGKSICMNKLLLLDSCIR